MIILLIGGARKSLMGTEKDGERRGAPRGSLKGSPRDPQEGRFLPIKNRPSWGPLGDPLDGLSDLSREIPNQLTMIILLIGGARKSLMGTEKDGDPLDGLSDLSREIPNQLHPSSECKRKNRCPLLPGIELHAKSARLPEYSLPVIFHITDHARPVLIR